MHDLDFNLRPSTYYLVLLSVTFMIALGIMLALPFIPWAKILGVVFLVIYGAYHLWHVALLRSPHAITRIRRTADGRWFLFSKAATHEAVVCGDSTVTTMVSVLRLTIAKQRWPLSCVVFRDALSAKEYRVLLVALKVLSK
jgi:hypothetical protein